MPKNKIEIIDNTSGGTVQSRVRTIYIPGPSSSTLAGQVLCTNTIATSAAKETSLYYQDEERGWDTTSLSFKLAEYLIDTYGFQVIYEGIGSATTIPDSSWKKLKYLDLPLDYITTGQYGYIDKTAVTVAAYRKDCAYLADHIENPLQSFKKQFTVLNLSSTAPTDWTTDLNKYFVKVAQWENLISDSQSSFPYQPNKYYARINTEYILQTSTIAPEDFYSSFEYDSSIRKYKSNKYGILNSDGSKGYINASSGSDWNKNIYYEREGDSEESYRYFVLQNKPEDFDTNPAKYYIAYIPYNTSSSTNYVVRYYYTLDSDVNIKDTELYVQAVRNEFDYAIGTDTNNSTYAAGFTPWFYTNIKTLGENTAIPASFGYLFAYANSIKTNPLWFAAAGPDRGLIPELVAPVINYNRLDIEVLQARSSTEAVELDGANDNVGIAINPIAYIRPFGYLLYGNRTLRYNQYDAGGSVGELKASSFLNIRNLVSLIARTASQAAERYKFDQNSSLLWNKFTSVLYPILDSAVSGSGILGYSLTQLPTDKKARLKAKIVIVPIEAVEDMELTIELADSIVVSES